MSRLLRAQTSKFANALIFGASRSNERRTDDARNVEIPRFDSSRERNRERRNVEPTKGSFEIRSTSPIKPGRRTRIFVRSNSNVRRPTNRWRSISFIESRKFCTVRGSYVPFETNRRIDTNVNPENGYSFLRILRKGTHERRNELPFIVSFDSRATLASKNVKLRRVRSRYSGGQRPCDFAPEGYVFEERRGVERAPNWATRNLTAISHDFKCSVAFDVYVPPPF